MTISTLMEFDAVVKHDMDLFGTKVAYLVPPNGKGQYAVMAGDPFEGVDHVHVIIQDVQGASQSGGL
jgi:hypothetical protein